MIKIEYAQSSNETSHLSARRLVNTARSSIIDRGNENGSIVGDNGIGGGCSALDENRSQHGSDGGGGSSNAVVADNERDIEGIVQVTVDLTLLKFFKVECLFINIFLLNSLEI